jgi:Ser/Thr protein kinase RdoA (MazF antagonist)
MTGAPPRPDLALAAYGLEGAAVTPLEGGMVNHVYRVNGQTRAYALKHYSRHRSSFDRVASVWSASEMVRRHGLPVPMLIPNLDGQSLTEIEGDLFVLTEFVHGRQYPPGTMPSLAAFRMGDLLQKLVAALAELPATGVQPLPDRDWITAHLNQLLAAAATRRASDQVDEAAYNLLVSKLAALERWEGPAPMVPARWIHADYQWRNVLFDAEEQPVAIIDFDNLRVGSAAHEVMRCLAYSFPEGQSEAFDLFRAYARASAITAVDALEYVRYWSYNCLFRTWPLNERYLNPDLYQPRWDVFILQRAEWWDENADSVADRLAAIAAEHDS